MFCGSIHEVVSLEEHHLPFASTRFHTLSSASPSKCFQLWGDSASKTTNNDTQRSGDQKEPRWRSLWVFNLPTSRDRIYHYPSPIAVHGSHIWHCALVPSFLPHQIYTIHSFQLLLQYLLHIQQSTLLLDASRITQFYNLSSTRRRVISYPANMHILSTLICMASVAHLVIQSTHIERRQ